MGAERLVHDRGVEHRRVELGVRAEQPAVRQCVVADGRFDHQDGGRRGGAKSPHATTRKVEIITGREDQPAIVAEQLARALVDEEQLVAVGVAGQGGHRAPEFPEPDLDLGVAKNARRLPRQGLGGVHRREIEGARPQRALERGPARRRSLVMEEGGGPEKALLGDLALVGAFRHVGVGLARMNALGSADGDPVAGQG